MYFTQHVTGTGEQGLEAPEEARVARSRMAEQANSEDSCKGEFASIFQIVNEDLECVDTKEDTELVSVQSYRYLPFSMVSTFCEYGSTGLVANPARGQLNRTNYIFPAPIRA